MKVFTLTLLLSILYSWDELKYIVLSCLKRVLFKTRAHSELPDFRRDFAIGKMLSITGLSLAVLSLLGSAQAVGALLVLFLVMLSIAVISWVSALVSTHIEEKNRLNILIPAAFTLGGFFSPTISMLTGYSSLKRKTFTKIILLLSIPVAIALLLKAGNPGTDLIAKNIDNLIIILSGAVIVQIVIDLLKSSMRAHRFRRLGSYFRLVIGIVLIFLLF